MPTTEPAVETAVRLAGQSNREIDTQQTAKKRLLDLERCGNNVLYSVEVCLAQSFQLIAWL